MQALGVLDAQNNPPDVGLVHQRRRLDLHGDRIAYAMRRRQRLLNRPRQLFTRHRQSGVCKHPLALVFGEHRTAGTTWNAHRPPGRDRLSGREPSPEICIVTERAQSYQAVQQAGRNVRSQIRRDIAPMQGRLGDDRERLCAVRHEATHLIVDPGAITFKITLHHHDAGHHVDGVVVGQRLQLGQLVKVADEGHDAVHAPFEGALQHALLLAHELAARQVAAAVQHRARRAARRR